MNQGKAIKDYLKQHDIRRTNIAREVKMEKQPFYRALELSELPDDVKAKLAEIGFKFVKNKLQVTYTKKNPYDYQWFEDCIRILKYKGVIKEIKDIADATGYDKSNLTLFKKPNGQAPSKNFVQVFLKIYGAYLNETEIPVVLGKGRSAKLILPQDYTSEEVERVIKVLEGYR